MRGDSQLNRHFGEVLLPVFFSHMHYMHSLDANECVNCKCVIIIRSIFCYALELN